MLRFLFKLSLITLSLGQVMTISRGETGGVYLFDLVVGFFAVIGIVYFLSIRQLKIPRNLVYFFVFGLIGLISLVLYSPTLGLTTSLFSSFFSLRLFLYVTAACVVYNMLEKDLLSPSLLIKLFIFSTIFVTFLGFIQLLVLPDFTVLDASLGWDPHMYRLSSAFLDPNFTGAYISIGISLVLFYGNKYLTRRQYFWYLLFLVIGLIATFSRSSWAMAAIITFVYGIKYNWRAIIIGIVVLFLAYFSVPRIQTRITGATDPADSAQFRFISWKNTVEVIKDNMPFGVGFNSYRFVQKDYGFISPGTLGDHASSGSDSSLLLVLVTSGILGLVAFMIGLIYPLSNNLYWVVLFPGLMVNALFINALFYPQLMFLWLTLLVKDF